MHWHSWLTTAFKNRLAIENWPVGVPPPGSDFGFKSLKIHDLELLTRAFLANSQTPGSSDEPQPTIVEWGEGTFLQLYIILSLTKLLP